MIFLDQLGCKVELPSYPAKIISLVPSQTELLADLGAADQLAGITKFCIHPPYLRKRKPIVGGTKNFRFDVIDAIEPDLIIGNKEENYLEGIEKLQARYPVWMSNVITFEDALNMIISLGHIVNLPQNASALVKQIKSSFHKISFTKRMKALYLIWYRPWMAAGQETFIDTLLRKAGFQNCLELSRYPELSNDDIIGLNPDVIFLSSEPFPFKDTHLEEIQQLCRGAEVMKVHGDLFSWYGSRLLKSADYFRKLRIQLF